MSNVKIVKFVSGESAVADLSEKETSYVLKNPIVIMATPDGQLGMMPLNAFGTSETIEISKQHVLFVDTVDDEIKNIYNAKFGTGIITASGFNVVNPKR
jgi:hypothetical protein